MDIHKYLKKKKQGMLLSACTAGFFERPLASHSEILTKYLSLSNLPCQARLTLVDINSSETFFLSIDFQW